MPQNKDSKKTLRILFDEEKYDYIYIPRIQRDYAQGRNDEEAKMIRENILDDVSTCNPLSWGIVFGVSEDKDFEDGSRKKCFVPIDGQQRLTTLFLLNLYGAKRHKINFNYSLILIMRQGMPPRILLKRLSQIGMEKITSHHSRNIL